MKELLDAFWRAAAYCLHPKVIGLSLLPLLIGAGLAIGLGWFYWEPAVAAVRQTLESWALVEAGLRLVESWFGTAFRTMLAPLIVVLLAAPVIVVLSMLLVALLMVPSIVGLVSSRRFPALEARRGAGLVVSALWSMLCTLLALVALVVSLPLWFIPPLVLIVPPLIWGWLTYRVMAFDVLAEHADATERRELMRRHRWQLLAIGVVSGYLGAAPSLVWALGAFTLVFAPILIGVSVWLYTLVFAFSALWFAHFALAALLRLRSESMPVPAATPLDGTVIDLPGSGVATPPSLQPPAPHA
ncbi:EI24 domain-containing protein [Ideonella sp. A 288]|uniref:EI24 domain-containing protein n=1 Tax=Ideonella sp. A 288 TaxID=1962181 RepID=UPI000B4A71CB|nr:EI24 domain-containing protein [Ideonella sp. A 288]